MNEHLLQSEHHSGVRIMATLCEQLDAMLSLPNNWDGYGADRTDPGVVAWAKDFVQFFQSLEQWQEVGCRMRVRPTRVGGVQIEWEDSRFERELELNPDGSLGLLRTDKSSGEIHEESFLSGREAVAPGFLPRLGEITAVFAGAA